MSIKPNQSQLDDIQNQAEELALMLGPTYGLEFLKKELAKWPILLKGEIKRFNAIKSIDNDFGYLFIIQYKLKEPVGSYNKKVFGHSVEINQDDLGLYIYNNLAKKTDFDINILSSIVITKRTHKTHDKSIAYGALQEYHIELLDPLKRLGSKNEWIEYIKAVQEHNKKS